MPSPNLLPKPPLNWATEGYDWPYRDHSEFVDAAGLRWHVQRGGNAALPLLLLVHGTGAATHTWRNLVPLLTGRFQWLAMDLPGHAFTSSAPAAQQSLAGMSRALAELLTTMGMKAGGWLAAGGEVPVYALGHSAGAAIVAQMIASGTLKPQAWAGLNSALMPLRGLPGQVFAPVARALAATPLVPEFFAWRAGHAKVLDRLLASTGSRIDAQGRALYGRLVKCPAHAAGALGMMANWDLPSLEPQLATVKPAPLLLTALNDTTVPPVESARAAARMPGARVVELPGLGHLAHEEDAPAVWRVLQQAWPS